MAQLLPTSLAVLALLTGSPGEVSPPEGDGKSYQSIEGVYAELDSNEFATNSRSANRPPRR
jgi:hypothetical protein